MKKFTPSNHSWDQFTDQDHAVWAFLFDQQVKILKNRATKEFVDSLETLEISRDCIPKFSDLNKVLKKATGFSIVACDGLVPDDVFFQLLSERKFPSTTFIRKWEQIDYLEEPDIFHDVFGHVPLLVNPIFADFMELFGRKGLEAIDRGLVKCIATFYWFTVEFGLIKTAEGLRIYGAGIVSSKGESLYSLESDIPSRLRFNPYRAMQTQYHTDSFQRVYFVIQDFKDLFESLRTLNLDQEMLLHFPKIAQDVVLNPQETL